MPAWVEEVTLLRQAAALLDRYCYFDLARELRAEADARQAREMPR